VEIRAVTDLELLLDEVLLCDLPHEEWREDVPLFAPCSVAATHRFSYCDGRAWNICQLTADVLERVDYLRFHFGCGTDCSQLREL
jgi:hypothetical protein